MGAVAGRPGPARAHDRHHAAVLELGLEDRQAAAVRRRSRQRLGRRTRSSRARARPRGRRWAPARQAGPGRALRAFPQVGEGGARVLRARVALQPSPRRWPVASGPGARPRGAARHHAARHATRPLCPLNCAPRPAAWATALMRRASRSPLSPPNTGASAAAAGGCPRRSSARSCMAVGVMATTAPTAAWSDFERRTVTRPLPAPRSTPGGCRPPGRAGVCGPSRGSRRARPRRARRLPLGLRPCLGEPRDRGAHCAA